MPSNPIVNVNGETLERLKVAMSFFDSVAIGYAIDQEKGLVFFKADGKDMTPLPGPMDLDACAEIAFEWLKCAHYGDQPDHDGDNEKGWRCYCDDWGHIDKFGWRTFMAVQPMWIMYGK